MPRYQTYHRAGLENEIEMEIHTETFRVGLTQSAFSAQMDPCGDKIHAECTKKNIPLLLFVTEPNNVDYAMSNFKVYFCYIEVGQNSYCVFAGTCGLDCDSNQKPENLKNKIFALFLFTSNEYFLRFLVFR